LRLLVAEIAILRAAVEKVDTSEPLPPFHLH